MKPRDQVVSLELAKKLQKLGVKQESTCYWVDDKGTKEFRLTGYVPDLAIHFHIVHDKIAAFTVAEIGEMLGQFWSGKQGSSFQCKRWVHESDDATQVADTEADARAKMLVWLIENKLWSPD